MTRLNRRSLSLAAVMLLTPGWALAQDIAPPPKKAPRTPVTQQALQGGERAAPPKSLSGQITVMDTEQLRLNGYELRLFGIVPPQLSANYGPQARGVLDNLTASLESRCNIRDRDRAGRYLATCHGRNDADLALELLKRGLAIAARGSLQPTELAPTYFAAEQAAQAQKLGLWSVVTPPAAKPEPKPEPQPVATTPPAPPEVKPAAIPVPVPTTEVAPVTPVATATSVPPAEKPVVTTPADDTKAAIVSSLTTASAEAEADQTISDTKTDNDLLAKYQLLLSALLMLATALGITFSLWYHRWSERRTEIRATAAALRGELQAARTLIVSRLRAMAEATDEKSTAWPRVRTLVFQAYVGRLGLLGAELARQIASIYGLASDYTAYYSTPADQLKHAPVGKKAAMETLQNHIEEVLPKLEQIEASGQRPPLPHFTVNAGSLPRPTPPGNGKPMPLFGLGDLFGRVIGVATSARARTKALPGQTKTLSAAPDAAKDEPTLQAEATGNGTPSTEQQAARIKPLWEILRGLRATETPTSVGKEPKQKPADESVPDYTAMSQEEIDILAFNELTEEDFKAYDEMVSQSSRRARRVS